MVDGGEVDGTVPPDEAWLGSWANELEHFLPGILFPLKVMPEPVPMQDSFESEREAKAEMEDDDVDADCQQEEAEAAARMEMALTQRQAADYQQWERAEVDRELKRAQPRVGGSGKRCRMTVEVATGSNDVPDNPPPTQSSTQMAQANSVPNVLQFLEFAEYDDIYRRWKAGELSTVAVEQQYGQEVAELVMTHDAVAEQDVDTLTGCPRGEGVAVPQDRQDDQSVGLSNASTLLLSYCREGALEPGHVDECFNDMQPNAPVEGGECPAEAEARADGEEA
ncbi:unnamed protein product, partial [Symbiodinium sp. CCMP2456]